MRANQLTSQARPRPRHSAAHALGLLLFLSVGIACLAAACGDGDAGPVTDGGADAGTPDRAAEQCSPGRRSLTIMIYNVHGLPQFITGDDTRARMVEISPKLGGFDLVALQENFAHSAELMKDVTYPQVDHSDKIIEGRAYGSGLTMLSLLPLKVLEKAPWEVCNGLAGNANDCLAAKGFQGMRVALKGGCPAWGVDVYNLHMDAGGDKEDRAARDKQVEQLLEAIGGHSSDRAVLVVGDTNMKAGPSRDRDKEQYERLLKGAGLGDSCAAIKCPELDHIDRIMFRSSDRVKLTVQQWQVEKRFVDQKGRPLSDHPAISVRFLGEMK